MTAVAPEQVAFMEHIDFVPDYEPYEQLTIDGRTNELETLVALVS